MSRISVKNPFVIQTEESKEYRNKRIIYNNKVFAFCLVLFQIAVIFLYGFYVRPQAYVATDQPLFIPTGVAILLLVGFGLVFSYKKNMSWSGLGFTFMITVIVFQYFFIVSAFWNYTGVGGYHGFVDWGNTFKVYLSEGVGATVQTFGLTAVQAFKCSMSMVVAFAIMAGKTGPLQTLLTIVVGAILYELNRQLIGRFSSDAGGSMAIFCFGGFFGAAIQFVVYFAKQKKTLIDHPFNKSSKFSTILALLGGSFCWIFFPFLSIDSPNTLFISYAGGVNAIYAISTSALLSIGLSCLFFGRLRVDDLLYGIIAGGVIVGSSSTIIFNPLGAMLLGAAAAILQSILNVIERNVSKKGLFSNNAFTVFGLQGLAGGLCSAAFAAINSNNYVYDYSSLTYPHNTHSAPYQIAGTAISCGIGILGGLAVGVLLTQLVKQTINDHYHDRAYWIIDNDGISDQEHVYGGQPAPSDQNESNGVEDDGVSMSFEEPSSLNNQHAYL